jgi:hypothetical protein
MSNVREFDLPYEPESAECVASKEALLAAETDAQFQLPQRKMETFCND